MMCDVGWPSRRTRRDGRGGSGRDAPMMGDMSEQKCNKEGEASCRFSPPFSLPFPSSPRRLMICLPFLCVPDPRQPSPSSLRPSSRSARLQGHPTFSAVCGSSGFFARCLTARGWRIDA